MTTPVNSDERMMPANIQMKLRSKPTLYDAECNPVQCDAMRSHWCCAVLRVRKQPAGPRDRSFVPVSDSRDRDCSPSTIVLLSALCTGEHSLRVIAQPNAERSGYSVCAAE